MAIRLKKLLLIFLISILPTIFIWIPFFFRIEKVWGIPLPKDGMATIVANYDGPLFIATAKTFYNKEALKQNYAFGLPTEYYAAHFPLFPLLIKAASPLFGFPYSMLIVTVFSSFLATYFFHKFISEYVGEKNALWTTIVFSIFPARWLIVRSVGSAEPLFMAAIIASFYYFNKKNYLWAGVWGAIAQATKSPGILLFVAYFAAYFLPRFRMAATSTSKEWFSQMQISKFLPIFSIPISLFGIFYFYKIRMGDFLAYFHSGDNIHLFFPPFQIFNYSAPWVGTFWLEEVIFVYLFGLLGIAKLIRMKAYNLALFVGIFFASVIFVSHRDIIRYSLPIVPFLITAFSKEVIQKEFKIIVAILAIPIYLFSLTYISQNVMQISNWTPLL